MQAVIMAGGKGTRLRPYTSVLPKPLVPIGDISILEMVLTQLKHFGFKNIIISVGYKAEIIMAVIGDGERFGLNVTYHFEEIPLGTVGALALMDCLEDDFLVMNGDVCTNLDFHELYKFHKASDSIATVGTYSRHEKIELGVLTIDKNRKIVGFQEKPEFNFLVSMGIYALSKASIKYIPVNTYFGFDDLMRKFLESKVSVQSYEFIGKWCDIGRPDDYQDFLEEFKKNRQDYLPNQD